VSPDRRSAGGVRYGDLGKIMGLDNQDMPTIGYARVSSHDQNTTSSVSRTCSKRFAPPKAGGTRSLPISAPI
jgi:hypothetical protein